MPCSKKDKANKGKQTKATFVAQRFLGHNCWLPRCAHVRLPRYMPKRTYMSIRTAARDPDSGQGQRACLLAQHVLSKGWTKQLYWLGKLCKFANLTYDFCDLRCHAGDEMWNCIAKTCRTKLLGTPLLKTHRRVSAKCVTYSGTAWKFQQAQGNALLRWNVVCRYSSLKTHFQLTSSRTNFNTLHRKTSLWHEDSWDTTVWDNTDVSGVNVSCCRTAWRYQQA